MQPRMVGSQHIKEQQFSESDEHSLHALLCIVSHILLGTIVCLSNKAGPVARNAHAQASQLC